MSDVNPLDVLVPLVQAVNHQEGDERVQRSFFAKPGMDLTIFYAIVQPTHNLYLTEEYFPKLGVDHATLEAMSMQNWLSDHSDLAWESIEIAGDVPVMAARSESDTMATILLSHGHLKGMHKHFGTKTIYLGIPDRFTVLVHSNPLIFPQIVQGMYGDALEQGTQFSSDLFVCIDGEIVATARQSLTPATGVALVEKMIVHIFLHVSLADGNMDDKEIVKFLKILKKFASGGGSMFHQASKGLIEKNLAPFTEVVTGAQGQDSLVFIANGVTRLKDSFGEEIYAGLAQDLNSLADAIAKASGSLFSRSKVSDEESVALFMIATALQ